MPRRPARPVSCWYSPEVSAEVSEPRNLANRSTTTVRAGMLMPRASVSVANTTFSSPSEKQRSTAWRKAGHQAGVVGRHPRLEGVRPGPVPERAQVGVGQPFDGRLDQVADPGPLVVGGEAHPVLDDLAGGVVARGPREDEGDGGQHAGVGQVLDHLGPPGRPEALVGRALPPVVQPQPVGVGPPVAEQGQHGHPVTAPLGHRVVVVEGDRTVGLDHHPGGPPHRRQPPTEVPGVVDGGRQAHEGHAGRGQHEDLLPHRAPPRVLEVVDLVEHHHGQVVEQRRAGEEHVAQDLGGHDHDRAPGPGARRPRSAGPPGRSP